MTISLNTDQYYLQNQLNISTSRMQNYADMSIDDIIEAEAENGNKAALNYGRELFGSTDELIEAFQLDNPTNKYNIISQMNGDQKSKVLELLEAEDMVMGLNFFTQDKLEEMLNKVSVVESANVALEAFPLAQVIEMIPEEQLEQFFMSPDVKKEAVSAQLGNMDPEILIQMSEGITGEAADMSDISKALSQMSSLPDKQFKETMAAMDPAVQQTIIFQMADQDPDVLLNFSNQTYTDMVSSLQKPDMVKSMIALDNESLQIMTQQLPDDLFAIVATQVDTDELAELLINRCPDLLEKFTSMSNSSTIR